MEVKRKKLLKFLKKYVFYCFKKVNEVKPSFFYHQIFLLIYQEEFRKMFY